MTPFSVVKPLMPHLVAAILASGLHFLIAPAAAQLTAPGLASAPASGLACLRGQREAAVALFACAADCAPIPWQLDERDGAGRWALDQGPEPNLDDPPGVIDDNDELLWMAADGGRRATRRELAPSADCVVELEVARASGVTWVYAVAAGDAAPRSPRRYVSYDPAADRVEGERVAVGFGAATPRYLALRGAGGGAFGPNLLDRLKVRAHARLLGIIPLGRDEDDIEYAFSAWRAGPVRVLRREYQWVRLASWLRTPIFETETLMTRDALILPVRLRLNFPPTYFFAGIEVQAVLDFRDLRGWQVAAAGRDAVVVGAENAAALDGARSDWVALRGPDATLVLELVRGETLATLVPTIVYRDDGEEYPPEAVDGELPGLGYRLTEWSDVDRGAHWFAAVARALPAGADLRAFERERADPITVSVRELPP